MKRYSLTIVMAVLLAGLGGYVYWVELPTERTKTETEATEKKLLPFTEREITGVTVHSESGDIVLVSKDGAWRITAPLQTEADTRAVQSMLRSLVLGKITRVVEEQATALAPFGLDKPSMTLTLTGNSQQETVSIGESGPISSTLYAIRASDKKILLTDLSTKDFLNKTLLSFRKKEVLPVDSNQAERMRLTYPKTEIVLYRTDDKDNKKKWSIRYPIEARADQPEVRTLLMKLDDLKALAFIDPGSQRDEQLKKLAKPDIKIMVYAGGVEHTVKLYQPDPSTGEAFAVTTPEAPIYRINPVILKDLTKDLFTLQDKRLLGMEGDDVAMLEVKTREDHYTLIRQNNTWVLEDAPQAGLDQEKVALFVSRVVDLPAEIRIVKQAGPLAPYGLTSPTAEFTATGKDGKATGRLVLGTRTGGLVYAMGRGLPGVFQARSDLLTQIPSKHGLEKIREGT
ncbi:MAG: DUF4340 domain-containing protein [Nitrospirales bacterium]|nr:DUF4340 domain-containing protein [Nitrospirales bacterium]